MKYYILEGEKVGEDGKGLRKEQRKKGKGNKQKQSEKLRKDKRGRRRK